MKNSKALFLDLVNQIKIDESLDEIRSMVYLLFESLLSFSRTDILAEKEIQIGQVEEKKIHEAILRINNNEPIQYILGEADFYRRKFIVNSSVLVPRGETEELVRAIVLDAKGYGARSRELRILDIGTGSGCIAITLSLEIPGSEVFATDVSSLSVEVAEKNARQLNGPVQFFKHDILKEEIPLQHLDIIVSNPPYVAWSERKSMKNNVVTFEPHLALFVPDDDPLRFYKVIAEKAGSALRHQGLLAVEINERFGKDVERLFKDYGFTDVQVVKDLFGKERIVKGILP